MSELKKIDANIVTIRQTGDAFNALVHETAMLIMKHALPVDKGGHGDCSRALALAIAMPASVRRETLIKWFAAYSPITIIIPNDRTPLGKVGMLKEGVDKKFVPFNIEGAESDPWFAMAERDPEKKTYDFAALLELARRLGKTIDKKVSDGLVVAEDVDSAKAIVAALAAFNVARVAPKAANFDANLQKEDKGAEELKTGTNG